MKKHYISPEDLLQDSFLLAKKIFDLDYYPNHIIGILRGGPLLLLPSMNILITWGSRVNTIPSKYHPTAI